MLRPALLALSRPLAAHAAESERLTPQQFEDYVTGKTLMYGFDGQHYGGEDYLPGRNVRWSYLDGRCKTGQWYPEDGNICFVYEDNPEPQCWSFFLRDSMLAAHLANKPESEEPSDTADNDEPLLCLGPDEGV